MFNKFLPILESTSAPLRPSMPKTLQFLEVSWYELRLVWKLYWQVSFGCQNRLSIGGITSLSIWDCKASTSPPCLSTSWMKYPFSLKNSLMGFTPLTITLGSSATTTFMAGHLLSSSVCLKSSKQDALSSCTRSDILLNPNLLQLSMRYMYCDCQQSFFMQRVILTRLSQKFLIDCSAGKFSVYLLRISLRSFSRQARMASRLLSKPWTVLVNLDSLEKASRVWRSSSMIIQQQIDGCLGYYLFMQNSKRKSLLDSFINYCSRAQSCTAVTSPTNASLRYNRTPLHRQVKQGSSPTSTTVANNMTILKRRKMAEKVRNKKMEENRQLLNITPVVVYTSQSIKRSRGDATVIFNRRSLRAKTECQLSHRSGSAFLTQHRAKQQCETPFEAYSSGEINKNRPFTAFPSGEYSVNRLRTIQIQLPKYRKIGRASTCFDDSLSAWETSNQ